jgi:hypothetical protein
LDLLPAYSIIGIAVATLIVIVDFYLLRKEKMQGRGFLLWLLIGAVVGVFSAVPTLFGLISWVFQTQNPVNGIMASSILFLLIAVFYIYYKLSEMHSLLMKLAMEVSVRKYAEQQEEPKEPQKTEGHKDE